MWSHEIVSLLENTLTRRQLNKRLSFFFQALDIVLEELTGHLDEDIQELLEREKQRNMFDL